MNSIEAEREFWRQDIINKIAEFEPGTESIYENSKTSLLSSLVKVVKKQNL